MAVKTITIDMEAYEALKRQKKPGQSFSQVIKEHFRGKGMTGADLLRLMGEMEPCSEEFLDIMDEIIEDRKEHPVETPEW